MKLSEYKDVAFEYTGHASDRIRAAALGGIAIAWIFKIDLDGGPVLPDPLVVSLILFGIGLFLDVLQSVTAAVIWTIFHRHHERKLEDVKTEDPDLDHPTILPNILYWLFYTKMIPVLGGYVVLVYYFVNVYWPNRPN